ncbi:MAG: SDR family NAD(P)-dependent oxidoreductase [Leptospiraceae bacterium]|nr:SDR family NAD(P)-dependent oxidoreductase [Leptospiraceae bacterium]MCP5511742.1 SDR family NAD(P)-dependent oxidoreductase [Leptospiraceae bacterium]
MKNVLIIAATSDIGMHIVDCFAKRGFNLSITGRDTTRLKVLKDKISEKYNKIVKDIYFDISDFDTHSKFISDLDDLPDVVVCCFGYYGDQELALSNFEETYKTIAVNYLGAVSLLNILSEKFISRRSGSIGVISSVAGIRGRQKNFLYGSTKAGLTTYLSGLRNRLHFFNISVTTILLGPVYTRMSEGHNLMPVLTARPEVAAEKITDAILKKKNEVTILYYWKIVMFIIKLIPESIFKRLKPF